VPYGGAGNTTEVTFTNAVRGTQLKICKTTSSALLVGDTFTFHWEYQPVVGGRIKSGEVSLTIASVGGIVCSALLPVYFGGPAAVNPDGSVTPISVYEEDPTSYSDVGATSATWSGTTGLGGLLVSASDNSASGWDTVGYGACVKFDPGSGTNVVTFTNDYYPQLTPQTS
jgi:hypothetical protein